MITYIPFRFDEELCEDEQRKRPRLSASTGSTTIAKNLLDEFIVASRTSNTPSHKKSIVVYELSDDSSSSSRSLLVNNNIHGRSNTYLTPIIMMDDSDEEDMACLPVLTTNSHTITTVRGGSGQPFPDSDKHNDMSDSDDSVDHMITSLLRSHEQSLSVYKTDKSIVTEEPITPALLPSTTGKTNSPVFIIDALGKIHSTEPVPHCVNPSVAVVDEKNFDTRVAPIAPLPAHAGNLLRSPAIQVTAPSAHVPAPPAVSRPLSVSVAIVPDPNRNGLQNEFPAGREHNEVQRMIGVEPNHLIGPGNNPGPIPHGPAPLLLNPGGALTIHSVGTTSNVNNIQPRRAAQPAENELTELGRDRNHILGVPNRNLIHLAILGNPHHHGVGNGIPPNIGAAIPAGNNHPLYIPRYTGGFRYANHMTLTYTAHTHNGLAATQHGMLQAANEGHGLAIDPNNLIFNNHHRYIPNWVRPLVLGNCWTTVRDTGWCMACSYKLVNPRDQERETYYSPTPASPHPNYAYYLHYPCAHSHLVDYNTVRFNAVMALYNPHQLRWAVSQNNGSQGRGQKWAYIEVVDLFIALKLSGQLQPDQLQAGHLQADLKDWNLVLRYAPVLQVRGRNTQMIARKFHQMKLAEGYVHLFTADFHDAAIVRNPQFDPPNPQNHPAL
jgi:hypothetical protein